MTSLVEYLSRHYERLAEVGIGNYTKVALALEARGLTVVATDIHPRAADFTVHMDDIWEPQIDLYRGAQAVYAIRPPPELLPPLKSLARRLGVDLIVKPLAAEPVDGRLHSAADGFFHLFPFSSREAGR